MPSKLPNLFIPGAGKSGTSTLHQYLNCHPNITMSEVKEPHFWTQPNFENYTEKDWQHYADLFDVNEHTKYKGESSTGYMLFPNFIERIKATYNDSPKFIFILRNPIDRAYSHYWWLKGIGSEKMTFLEAFLYDLEVEPSHKTNLAEGNYKSYYQFSLYGKWLARFFEHFDADQIKVISYEHLRDQRKATLNSCFKFLGLNALENMPEIKSNKTVILKYPFLYKMSKRIAFSKSELPTWVKNLIPQKVKYFFRVELMAHIFKSTKSDKTYPKLSTEEREKIKAYFIEDVNLLKQLTGLPFTEWQDFTHLK